LDALTFLNFKPSIELDLLLELARTYQSTCLTILKTFCLMCLTETSLQITADHVVLCVFVGHCRSEKSQFPVRKMHLCRNQNSAGAALSGPVLLQREVDLCWSNLTLSDCPPEPTCAEMAPRKEAPPLYYHQANANCSVENPSPQSNITHLIYSYILFCPYVLPIKFVKVSKISHFRTDIFVYCF
jgi:hypothetical protein